MTSSRERSIAGLLILILVSTLASTVSPFDRVEIRDSGGGTIRSIARIDHLAYVAASAKQELRLAIGARDEVLPGELPDASRSEADASSIRRLNPVDSSRRSPLSTWVVSGRAPPLPGFLS